VESTKSVNSTVTSFVLCIVAVGIDAVGSLWRAMARSRVTNSGDGSVPTSSMRTLR
jgi:hypothetical protein